jgi:hypothetical protein
MLEMHSMTFRHLIRTKLFVPLWEDGTMRQQHSESVRVFVWKIHTYLLCSVNWRWWLFHFHVDIHEQNDRFVLYNSYSAWLRAGRFEDRIPVWESFLYMSRRTLGPTQLPLQWVSGLSRDKSGRGAVLTTYFLLAPRSPMSRTIPIVLFWAFEACSVNLTLRSLFVLTNEMTCMQISIRYC